LDHSILKLGLRGLKLGPIYQNIHPSDSRTKRLFQRAEQLNIPVLIHQGTTFCSNVSLEVANPILLQPIALEFPKLRLVIAHMGQPWIGETIALIRKHANLFADISALYYRPWQFYNALVMAQEYKVMHKLLLGSDYPVTTPAATIESLRKVNDVTKDTGLPNVSRDEIEALIHRDTLQLLGLE
jgi:predicted TIM-barrel fold metal-dependent hydrolase